MIQRWRDEDGEIAGRGAAARPWLSIIVPVRNEEGLIGEVIDRAAGPTGVEVIVVDGGSTDGTVAAAQARGVTVIRSSPGRAHQMNQGAARARGSALLFLHGDTRLPAGFEQHVRQVLSQPGVVAGAFRFGTDDPGLGLQLVHQLVRLRSCFLQLPYGDQGLFMGADVFLSLGGYRTVPIMEDLDLVLRLRRRGRVCLASATATTSARRWHDRGVFRTTALNQVSIAAWFLGISPARIAAWHRR